MQHSFVQYSCLVVMAVILSSCGIRLFDGDPPASSRYKSKIDKEYTFIVGILTPDSLRDYPQEVFVGKLVPNGQPPLPPFGSDSVVKRVLLTTRSDYRCEVAGQEDARVFIADQMGNKIQLHNVGKGLYRDVQNALRIRPMHQYNLLVEQGEKRFISFTTVPEIFHFTQPKEIDTIVKVALIEHPAYKDYFTHLLPINWSQSRRAYLYRIATMRSSINFQTLDHTFVAGDAMVSFADFDVSSGKQIASVTTKITIEALDSAYTRMYGPEVAFTGSDDFMHYYRKVQTALPPEQRTNITSNDGTVAGVFGSFSQAIVSFVAVPKAKVLTIGASSIRF